METLNEVSTYSDYIVSESGARTTTYYKSFQLQGGRDYTLIVSVLGIEYDGKSPITSADVRVYSVEGEGEPLRKISIPVDATPSAFTLSPEYSGWYCLCLTANGGYSYTVRIY